MTEKEIVEYLKNNRTKGVAFGFMPEEVQKWAIKNLNDIELYKADDTFDDDFELVDINGGDLTTIRSEKGYLSVFSNIVLTLRPDFEPEEKSQGGWVEFYIDKYGNAQIIDDDPTNPYLCDWYDWGGILSESSRLDWGLTAFGGWQYPNIKGWYMCPQMFIDGEYSSILWYRSEPSECKPAIPSKIRFWREGK